LYESRTANHEHAQCVATLRIGIPKRDVGTYLNEVNNNIIILYIIGALYR